MSKLTKNVEFSTINQVRLSVLYISPLNLLLIILQFFRSFVTLVYFVFVRLVVHHFPFELVALWFFAGRIRFWPIVPVFLTVVWPNFPKWIADFAQCLFLSRLFAVGFETATPVRFFTAISAFMSSFDFSFFATCSAV